MTFVAIGALRVNNENSPLTCATLMNTEKGPGSNFLSVCRSVQEAFSPREHLKIHEEVHSHC